MRLRNGIVYAAVGVIALVSLSGTPHAEAADGGESKESANPEVPDFHFDISAYGDRWMLGDKDGDGETDYAVYLDEENYKVREAVDYNKDGQMDDFYYYDKEVLRRQEVDTNYDQEIDLWVYMHRGVWVERYERDTDYDGEPEVVKNFDSSENESADQ